MADGISALDLPTVVLLMDPDAQSGRRLSCAMAVVEADRLIAPIIQWLSCQFSILCLLIPAIASHNAHHPLVWPVSGACIPGILMPVWVRKITALMSHWCLVNPVVTGGSVYRVGLQGFRMLHDFWWSHLCNLSLCKWWPEWRLISPDGNALHHAWPP